MFVLFHDFFFFFNSKEILVFQRESVRGGALRLSRQEFTKQQLPQLLALPSQLPGKPELRPRGVTGRGHAGPQQRHSPGRRWPGKGRAQPRVRPPVGSGSSSCPPAPGQAPSPRCAPHGLLQPEAGAFRLSTQDLILPDPGRDLQPAPEQPRKGHSPASMRQDPCIPRAAGHPSPGRCPAKAPGTALTRS